MPFLKVVVRLLEDFNCFHLKTGVILGKTKSGVILRKGNFKSLSLVKSTWPDLQVLKDFLFEWKLSDNSNGNCAKFWNEFNQ